MSVNSSSLQRAESRSSRRSEPALRPPAPSITPQNEDWQFEPCAATASYFLYAQRNVILCLHHDTLAIERRFVSHQEDVLWIAVDNASEAGAGRLVVSYDTGQTALVWDLFTGDEVARFVSYEQIKIAAWMKNGNIAFGEHQFSCDTLHAALQMLIAHAGNSQGNVILFEPSTSEHISARTIFDPITALAPLSDCRTFAIGFVQAVAGLDQASR